VQARRLLSLSPRFPCLQETPHGLLKRSIEFLNHENDRNQKKILVADFEPGIIDAYEGEDKLHQLMAYMDKDPFWVSSMEIKGTKRILSSDLQGDAKKQIISNQKFTLLVRNFIH